MNEFSEVLQRDFKYNKAKTDEIIKKIMDFTNLVEPKENLEIVKDDPDDDKVLECAITSESDYIVTYDRHLLDLKEFREIKIVKPEEIIGSL